MSVVLMAMSCCILCTAIMRIFTNESLSLEDVSECSPEYSKVLYFIMLLMSYLFVIALGIFVVCKNFPATLVFLSFVLLWKSLDIKNYCINSIVSFIKEKMKEE